MSWRDWLPSGGEAERAPASASPTDVQAIALDLLRDYEASGKGWFWATDADGCITYLSPCVAAQLGIDHAALLGTPLPSLFGLAEDDGAGHERTLPLLLRGHKTFSELPKRATSDSREFWYAISGRPQFDANGRFTGFRGNGADITLARQSQLDQSRMALYDALTGLANRHRMARQLDISMLVPQHGAPIKGRQAINDFFDWIETLMCGVDLFDDRAYQLPTAWIDPVAGRTGAALRVA